MDDFFKDKVESGGDNIENELKELEEELIAPKSNKERIDLKELNNKEEDDLYNFLFIDDDYNSKPIDIEK